MAFDFVTGLLADWGEPSAAKFVAAMGKEQDSRVEMLYALSTASLDGKAPVGALADVVGHEAAQPMAEQLQSDVGDLLWLLGVETDTKPEARARLLEVARPLLQCIPSKVLQERLEPNLLEELKLIKTASLYRTKYVRLNTRSYFTQTKYNLFQEETEGYAKLVETLNSTSKVRDLSVAVRSLIGQFDLDPNRVFDLILEAFECKIHEHARFMPLFSLFRPDALRNLLGFKFQHYCSAKKPTPRSLFNLVAFLISKQALSLSEIYPHLYPEDTAAKAARSEYMEAIAKTARKMESSMRMGGKGEEVKEAATLSEQVSLPSSCLDVAPFAGVQEGEDNQKIGLLVSMLQMHDWKTASMLLAHMRALQPSQNREVSKALCQRLSVLVRPSYKPVFNSLFGKDPPPPPADQLQASRMIDESGSFEELTEQVLSILYHLGPNLSHDVVLFTKVLRLVTHWYKTSPEAVPLERLMGRVFLPALSGVPMNPNLASCVWELLSKVPYTKRYQLYGQWMKAYDKHPTMVLVRSKARAELRKVVKRISTDTNMIKKCGKILGKLSHSNPIIVAHELLVNIERSPNMVQPTVDSLKYIGLLSHDVMTYIVLDHLAQPSKSKLKSDGKNIEDWLGGIANFTGQFFRKYSTADLTGILQYVLHQLKSGNFTDLVILHELVVKMSGVDLIEVGLTKDQVEARAGGDCLRSTITPLPGGRAPKRQIKQLKDTLVNNGFVVPLVVLMAQTRSRISFETDTKSLKVLSQLFDKCHTTLVMFLEFLQAHVSPAETYILMMPSLTKMCKTYHLDVEVAFAVLRPMLPLIYSDAPHEPPGVERKGNVVNYDEETEPDSFNATIQAIFPVPGWECISGLFGTFWSLSLYDVFVPNDCYTREIKKHHQALDALNASREQWDSHASNSSNETKKKKDYHSGLVVRLKEEQKHQRANHDALLQKLEVQKAKWLEGVGKDSRNEIIVQFLQTCVFPRCKFSVTDALYCARFVHILHKIGTPYFSTLQYFEKVTKDVASMVFACTENEANRLGIFLSETLSLLHHWRSDKKVYERECEPKPGFSVSFSNPESARATYAEFAKVSFKWHCRLVKSFVTCLESKEYLEIRNALIVLSKVVAHFPILKRAGQVIRDAVDKLASTEKRKDLKVLASSYLGMLENNKANMISEAEFKNEPTPAKKTEKSERRPSTPASSAKERSTSTTPGDRGDRAPRQSSSGRSSAAPEKLAPADAKDRTSSTPKDRTSSTPKDRTSSTPKDRDSSSTKERTSATPKERTSSTPAEKNPPTAKEKTHSSSRERTASTPKDRTSSGSTDSAASPMALLAKSIAASRQAESSSPGAVSGSKRGRSDDAPAESRKPREEREAGSKRPRESSKDRQPPAAEPSQKKRRTSEDPRDPGKDTRAAAVKESPRTRGREGAELRDSRGSGRSGRRGGRDSQDGSGRAPPREDRRRGRH